MKRALEARVFPRMVLVSLEREPPPKRRKYAKKSMRRKEIASWMPANVKNRAPLSGTLLPNAMTEMVSARAVPRELMRAVMKKAQIGIWGYFAGVHFSPHLFSQKMELVMVPWCWAQQGQSTFGVSWSCGAARTLRESARRGCFVVMADVTLLLYAVWGVI